MTALRDEGWDDVPPAMGTFRTSWRTVLRRAVGFGAIIPLGVIGLYLVNGDPIDASALRFIAASGVLTSAFFVGRYRLFGVRAVKVTRDAVVVERFTGLQIHLPWDQLNQVWEKNKWYFETSERSVDVRAYGFTVRDWVALSSAIQFLKDAGPVGTLPGVLAGLDEEHGAYVAVYEPQYSPALWWGPALFGLVGLVALFTSIPRYVDGTWLEDVGVTVFCPLAGLGFVFLFAVGLPRLARRITFLPDSLVVERYVGLPYVTSYEDVSQMRGSQVYTKGGRFVVGDRNSGAFRRLIELRLGERGEGAVRVKQPPTTGDEHGGT